MERIERRRRKRRGRRRRGRGWRRAGTTGTGTVRASASAARRTQSSLCSGKPPAVGRALPGGGGKTEVRNLAGVLDFHSAFGLTKGKEEDEDDEEIPQFHSTAFVGGKKKTGNQPGRPSAAAPGTGGYGSVLSSVSSASGSELAEAARTIPYPLFGDPSRSAGRRGGGGGANNTTSTPFDVDAFPGIPENSEKGAAGGESQDVADAYALNLLYAGGGEEEPEDSPLPTVNPLFKSGGGGAGRGKVRALVRSFDSNAQARAVGPGPAAVDNKAGPTSPEGRKQQSGRNEDKKGQGGVGGGGGGGGGGGSAAISPGSPVQLEVFAIKEAGVKEEEKEEKMESDDNDENV